MGEWGSRVDPAGLCIASCFILLSGIRNHQRNNCSSAAAGGDGQFPTAHHFKSLPDVLQGNMWFTVIGRFEIGAVVDDGNHGTGIDVSCPDGDA